MIGPVYLFKQVVFPPSSPVLEVKKEKFISGEGVFEPFLTQSDQSGSRLELQDDGRKSKRRESGIQWFPS